MSKKGDSAKKAQAARAARDVAAVSSKITKVTRAVHGAIVKALPKAKLKAFANPGGIGLPLQGFPTGGASVMGVKDPVEPKLTTYVVFVVQL